MAAFEADEHLGGGDGEALADADEEGDAGPALIFDLEAEDGERLNRGAGGDANDITIAAELGAGDVIGVERADGLEELGAGIAHVLVVAAGGGFHAEAGDELEHVVLDDVADGSGLVVETATVGDAEVLGHSDLDAFNVGMAPAGLDERVGVAEVEEVLDGLLAEVVVDAEDGALREDGMEGAVEDLGGGAVVAEGFFDNHAGTLGAAGFLQGLGDGGEEAGRDGEVVERALGAAQGLAQGGEGGGVGIVALDVAEEGAELGEGGGVDTAVVFEAVLGAGLEVVKVNAALGDAHDGDVEMAVADHGLEGGEDLLVGEVAGGAEEDDGVRREGGLFIFHATEGNGW
jgi:hypothetical protein